MKWIFTRDAMWKLFPGMLVYNLFGRYVLWYQTRCKLKADGRDWKDLPVPGWISWSVMKSIPRHYN